MVGREYNLEEYLSLSPFLSQQMISGTLFVGIQCIHIFK